MLSERLRRAQDQNVQAEMELEALRQAKARLQQLLAQARPSHLLLCMFLPAMNGFHPSNRAAPGQGAPAAAPLAGAAPMSVHFTATQKL